MRRWMSILFLLGPTCAESLAQAIVPATRPATQPALPNDIRNEIRWLEAKPLAPRSYGLSELVTFKIAAGRILATVGPAAEHFPSATRLAVDGLGGQWVAMSSGAQSLTLTRYDFDQATDNGLWRVRLQVDNRELTLRGYGGVTRRIGVHFVCTNDHVFGGVCPNRGMRTIGQIAPNLAELRRLNPELVRVCVRPMIARFGVPNPWTVGATSAYRAFPNIAPGPAVARRVEQLLTRFDSDVAEEREQASRDLATVGAPGVLAAIRLDRTNLSPEQLARIDQLLLNNDDLRAANAPAALRDSEFLLDCLEFDDIAIRTAAKSALSGLLRRPIDLDVNALPEARAGAVDKLWREMGAGQPAKQ